MLSIVVPTYNEIDNVPLLISRLEKAMEGFAPGRDYEIILVDDSSPDGTSDAVRRLMKEDSRLRLISRKGKLGLTSAVNDGVRAAKGDRIVVMDADLSHPPELVPKLADALSEADIVVGSRLIEGAGVENWPYHRKLITLGADALARIVLPIRCSDPLSGFFAVKKGIFMKTRFRTKGYKLLVNLLADNPGIRIKEIPYVFRNRHAGKTKLGLIETIQYLIDLARIRFA